MIFQRYLLVVICLQLLESGSRVAIAQSILSKQVSITIENKELDDALAIIGKKGDFNFSYNSNDIPKDSLVSFRSEALSIEEMLNQLLDNKFEYKQAGNYIILRYAPNQLSLIVDESIGNQDHYQISGRIINTLTKEPVVNASIYEKHLIQSALSNDKGFFTLRLKDISQTVTLTISKKNYKDLTTLFLPEIVVRPGRNRQGPNDGTYLPGDLAEVERTRLGRILTTSRQKIQSLNVGGFIANAPVQASLSPGLSTHGSLSGQVVNKVSLNATGGYSAGVNGAEIGLLFNINKKDVRYFQFAGAFNIVGGNAKGIQIGGLFNDVLDSVNGTQVSLGYNRIGGSVKGFQLGGLLNTVKGDVSGAQMALLGNRVKGNFGGFQFGALYNHVSQNFNGIQFSIACNESRKVYKGLQIAPVNYAKNLKGLQIGLVNIADTSSGYSLGLLNIIRTGYHKVSLNSNETINLNAVIKTGNKKLYTMLLGGMNTGTSHKLYALGIGLGKEYTPSKRLSINPEVTCRYLYQGAWQDVNLLNRTDLNLSFTLNNWIAISGGPALNYYYSEQKQQIPGYTLTQQRKTWLGWNLGVNLF